MLVVSLFKKVDKLAENTGATLGNCIPSPGHRQEVIKLLWRYQHLNAKEMSYVTTTDLIVHHVRLNPRTKPYNAKGQRRLPAHKEWWLKHLVSEGVSTGPYAANLE